MARTVVGYQIHYQRSMPSRNKKQELDEYRSLIKARGKPMTKMDRQKLEAIIDKWATIAFMAGVTFRRRHDQSSSD